MRCSMHDKHVHDLDILSNIPPKNDDLYAFLSDRHLSACKIHGRDEQYIRWSIYFFFAPAFLRGMMAQSICRPACSFTYIQRMLVSMSNATTYCSTFWPAHVELIMKHPMYRNVERYNRTVNIHANILFWECWRDELADCSMLDSMSASSAFRLKYSHAWHSSQHSNLECWCGQQTKKECWVESRAILTFYVSMLAKNANVLNILDRMLDSIPRALTCQPECWEQKIGMFMYTRTCERDRERETERERDRETERERETHTMDVIRRRARCGCAFCCWLFLRYRCFCRSFHGLPVDMLSW